MMARPNWSARVGNDGRKGSPSHAVQCQPGREAILGLQHGLHCPIVLLPWAWSFIFNTSPEQNALIRNAQTDSGSLSAVSAEPAAPRSKRCPSTRSSSGPGATACSAQVVAARWPHGWQWRTAAARFFLGGRLWDALVTIVGRHQHKEVWFPAMARRTPSTGLRPAGMPQNGSGGHGADR